MIVVKNLSKDFGGIKALDNLNFCLNKGDIVALLGAKRGRGRQLCSRLLTGYLDPTSGDVGNLRQQSPT